MEKPSRVVTAAHQLLLQRREHVLVCSRVLLLQKLLAQKLSQVPGRAIPRDAMDLEFAIQCGHPKKHRAKNRRQPVPTR